MSEAIGYEGTKCQVKISPKCEKKNAGYSRRPKHAQEGPWLDSCETCARVPYEQPKQFQSSTEESREQDNEVRSGSVAK